MNERADNINGLVEHQTMVRFSPKLAERVHREFVGAPTATRPGFEITWEEEREATVKFGDRVFRGRLFDLPCVTETYKMASKSRLFKSGDVGQILVVWDPEDEEDCAFYAQQRFDPEDSVLLSGITPPSTFVWSRIFRKQNRLPNIDFAKVEQDLGEVNVASKEDVQVEFIHPRELDTLMLKPGQRLVVDGVDVEPMEGLSVGQIIVAKRQQQEEELRRKIADERKRKKDEKKARKEAGEESKRAKPEDLSVSSVTGALGE